MQAAQEAHLRKLLDLGVDGFRFDAAKHMPADALQRYLDFVRDQSGGAAWGYLEVIEDGDTRASDYTSVAPVTDFVLYATMKAAFEFGGDLRSLRVPTATDDPPSVTFGRVHDNIRELFYVVNKAAERFDVPALNLTLTDLEGCYRELRNDFDVAIERRGEKKFVTRWGTWSRGGMAVEGRDALYFIREPWSQCQLR